MSDEAVRREIEHLKRLQQLLAMDIQLPLRIDIKEEGLSGRKLNITISGIRGLVDSPDRSSSPARANFQLSMEIPPGYPDHSIPNIRFLSPVPFHPHIYTHGGICWGTANAPQPNLWLADWLRLLVEYLQYNQDPAVMLGIDRTSPANGDALSWWAQSGRSISRYVPRIDLARLQNLINRSRG